jgi:hypothetical protein
VDKQREYIENIVVELDFPCACIADTAKMYIEDPPDLTSGLAPLEVCIGDTVSIISKASGGVPGYQFHWSTGDSSNAIRVFAPRDTSYRLKIADACGRKIEDSVQVRRRVPPYARIGGAREVCLNDTVNIPVHFNGVPPYSFSYNINVPSNASNVSFTPGLGVSGVTVVNNGGFWTVSGTYGGTVTTTTTSGTPPVTTTVTTPAVLQNTNTPTLGTLTATLNNMMTSVNGVVSGGGTVGTTTNTSKGAQFSIDSALLNGAPATAQSLYLDNKILVEAH